MTIYFDSDINCNLYLNNGEIVEYSVKWSYLVSGLLKYIYDNYKHDWSYLDTYYESGNPCGRLVNSETTYKLVDKELIKSDFDSIVIDNFLIDCELYLKSEPDNPRFYTITKEELLNNFISDMYDLHGNDWNYFDTYFHDSQENAYGEIPNDSYRRKHQKLTASGLKQRRWNINKEKWANASLNQYEIFYLIFFSNCDFIKIGQTFRRFEYRLYNYLFPFSDKEKRLFEGSAIDFDKSFIVETNIERKEIDGVNQVSLESIIKDAFEKWRHPDSDKFGNTREFLKNDCYSSIGDYIHKLQRKDNLWKTTSLAKYTGFANCTEMIDYNVNRGVCEKPNRFFNKKQNPTIYLKTTANK